MFYSSNQIKDVLICNICKNTLSDPRLVPCGRTFCNKCINSSQSFIFNCLCDKKTHVISEDGFPRNLTTEYLLNQAPDQVIRSEKVEQLKKEMDKIKFEMDDIEKKLNISEDRIREYCFSIRNEIDLSAERAIQMIQNQRDELFKNVSQYEEECIANLKKDNNLKKELENSIKEVKEFCSKWETTLENHKIEDSEVTNALSLCDTYLTEISRCKINSNIYIFNDKRIMFKNFERISEPIGQVMLETVGKLTNLSRLSSLNLKSIDSSLIQTDNIDMEILSDNKIFICAISDRLLKLFIYDLDESKVETRNQISISDDVLNKYIKSIKCAYLKNTIIVSLAILDLDYKKSINYLINSDNLGLQQKKTLDLITIDMSMNSEYICIFAREDGSPETRVRANVPGYYTRFGDLHTLNLYDNNLDLVRKINSKNNKSAREIISIKLNESSILLFKAAKVKIININNGLHVKTINLDGSTFSLLNQNYILSVEKVTNLFNLYNLDGIREHSEKIKDIVSPSFIKGTFGKVLIFDNKRHSIYF